MRGSHEGRITSYLYLVSAEGGLMGHTIDDEMRGVTRGSYYR